MKHCRHYFAQVCLNLFFFSRPWMSSPFFLLLFFYCWFQPRTLSTCHCHLELHVVPRPSLSARSFSAVTSTTLSRILFSHLCLHEFRLHTKEKKFSNIIIHTPNWITKIDTQCWLDWSTSEREWHKSHYINTVLLHNVYEILILTRKHCLKRKYFIK